MSTLAQGHVNLLCIVPKTLTETSRIKKETKNTEMLRVTCSADLYRCRPDSNDTKDTRVSAGSRRRHTVTGKNVCSRQNCQPRVTFDSPKPDARTTFNKDGEKHGQREILESRDLHQVPNKRRVEVHGQNRESLIRDVCTCLAPRVSVKILSRRVSLPLLAVAGRCYRAQPLINIEGATKHKHGMTCAAELFFLRRVRSCAA